MVNDKRYNPVIYSRLNTLCGQKDWEGLVRYLQRLSHAAFRTAGLMLGERVLVDAPEDDYWEAFLHLLRFDAKALLGTLLKAAVIRVEQKRLSLRHLGFSRLTEELNATTDRELDKHKILLNLIPVLPSDIEMEYLFNGLQTVDPRRRAAYLLRGNSLMCYFMLFRTLRFEEHDKDYLADCCRFLMKKGDSLSFNLARIVKNYYDLPQVKGTFSLRIRPYEMGRLDTSFETFSRVLSSI